ncbi:MAG TPA: UvrD-helicase domain-containing protein [Kofleriaceae bacterium]|nr:UvrD-helicase domain-containing protein [Kofleriaceae bacterium]
MTSPPIIVGASAGSGKTYRLTAEVTGALRPDSPHPARIEGLVAVTYTRKAQAELASRIRRTLVGDGAYDQAARLPVAYLGTVHAVCMRLLEELALDAGLSPYPEVMADDRGLRMRAAIEEALPRPMIHELSELARRLEIFRDSRTQRNEWVRPVFEIMELARGNRIEPDALPSMARRSASGLLALLPSIGDGPTLDAAFDEGLEQASRALPAPDDDTDTTARVRRRIVEIRDRRRHGDLHWSDWAWAAKASPGAKSRPLVAPLGDAAARYGEHPDLHHDLLQFTLSVFEAARLALAGYAGWKARRRVVDYADMIDQGLRLVEDRDVTRELEDRLDLVVVDEFQDTSPLQLALFTRLHRLAGRSVWVGDGKQCIFEYAGADPMLMDSVVDWVAHQGGAPERLERNHRSRPELVDACSELFARAFEPFGVDGASVRTTAVRSVPAELAGTPPFAVWWLDGKSAGDDADAIAEATARMLAERRTRVLDREHQDVRSAEARDVGILTATNVEARRIAAALQRRGVRASLPRDGLMQTPEGVLIDAALRWLVERGDRVARATLEALGGWNGLDPDGWLEARLRGDGDAVPAWLEPLSELRTELEVLSPAEVLDRAVRLLDAPSLCARWPDPRQRLGNLDALRALAARYEDRCARLRDPATVAGLVRYFAEAQEPVRIGDEERATDDQFSGGTDDAVTVSTYHRAKGLEWPIVVLTSLDRPDRRDAFDPCPESERLEFDPDDPLGGRWIRYWPWPFGAQQKVPLADIAAASAEGRRVAARERKERVRLLYVGFTRARDQLVLAVRPGKTAPKAQWLDELRGEGNEALLELPMRARDGAIARLAVAGRPFGCRVYWTEPGGGAERVDVARRRFARGTAPPRDLPRYRITPSLRAAGEVQRSYVVDRVRSMGRPFVPPRRDDWEPIGTAVHAFLAADGYATAASRRRAMADRIVDRSALGGVVDPATLLAMSDRLRSWIDERWPGAGWEREVPISAALETEHGERRIEGVIDLLLRVRGGVIVVDHKTFPAPSLDLVADRAAAFAPQLAAYAAALERCGETVLGAHLHFPVAAVWVDLRAADAPARASR